MIIHSKYSNERGNNINYNIWGVSRKRTRSEKRCSAEGLRDVLYALLYLLRKFIRVEWNESIGH